MYANPILAIIGAVALLGTAVYLLIKNWEKVAPFFAKVWNVIIDIFEFAYGPIVAIMLDLINFAKEHLLNGFVKVAEGVGKAIDWIAAKFGKETGAFESITTWIDKWVEPAHERLTFSFDRLRVAVDKTSDTMDKDYTPALEGAKTEADGLATSTDTLTESFEQLNSELAPWIAEKTQIVAGFQAASRAQLGLIGLTDAFIDGLVARAEAGEDLHEGDKVTWAERVDMIAAETAAALAGYQDRVDAFQAMTDEQKRIDAEAKEEEKQKEAAHQQYTQRLRQATWNLTNTLISSLGSLWGSYYDRLLQDETLSDKERKKIMRDRAKAEKATAIFQTIVNTARSIMEAAPRIPLMIMAGIAGALQLAVIAATPLPKLAEGGITPALLHPNEAIIPLDSSEAMQTLTTAVANAQGAPAGGGEQLFHVRVNIGAKTLYDEITKATRDRRILIDAGAVA